MHEAFISYRREHGFAFAKMLREMLKARGVAAYVDLDELRSGTFDDKLLSAIKAIPAFILVLTPSALDRCADEDDWLTKEVVVAVDSGRKIIPVLCDGFVWPKKWSEEMPEKIRMLSSYNSVIMDYNYINATVDKILEYMREDGFQSLNTQDNEPKTKNDVDGFFRENMKDIDNVTAVDLAFHAGSIWHQNVERLNILETLADAGVQIRVIVNTPEVAMQMGKHMRHKLKKYMPFEEAVSLWQNVADLYPNVQVRVTDIPMLRIQYTIRKKDPSQDRMRIKYYTHGVAQIDANSIQEFDASDYRFNLYRSEFEYIWKHTE